MTENTLGEVALQGYLGGTMVFFFKSSLILVLPVFLMTFLFVCFVIDLHFLQPLPV
jgi:heme A synthase